MSDWDENDAFEAAAAPASVPLSQRAMAARPAPYLDDLNPESLWRFAIGDFGPLLVAMDSHGGSLYREVQQQTQARREEVLASLGVRA